MERGDLVTTPQGEQPQSNAPEDITAKRQEQQSHMTKEMKEALDTLHNMNRSLQNVEASINAWTGKGERKKYLEREMSARRSEWQAVAVFLDKLFFVVFLLTFLLSLLTLFPTPDFGRV